MDFKLPFPYPLLLKVVIRMRCDVLTLKQQWLFLPFHLHAPVLKALAPCIKWKLSYKNTVNEFSKTKSHNNLVYTTFPPDLVLQRTLNYMKRKKILLGYIYIWLFILSPSGEEERRIISFNLKDTMLMGNVHYNWKICFPD